MPHGPDRPAAERALAGVAQARSLSDLAELLRDLRRRHARQRNSAPFTYRELASKTGWSFTVISDYFAGRVLPPTDRFDDLIRVLGATPAEQRLLAMARDRVEELRRRPAAAAVPRQLPAAVPHFTGRAGELATLDDLAARSGGTVLISAIEGTAGVGKTALAVHWAHRSRGLFPDGQLYVNLRGFDPAGQAVQPLDALRGFLDALGVAPQAIPVGLDARAALFRSLVADRRMLVVLDNARDAEQVRPLLPGTAGCTALVTSRNRIAGLIAVDGAEPLTLDLLSEAESRELLARRLGQERLDAEPEAAGRIVAICARLPLALSIVAAHAALHPRLSLGTIAAQLAGTRGLGSFAGPDPSIDMRTVFSWSYRALDPAAARLFRLLGQHPGPGISVPAAASLAAVPVGRARELLTALSDAHLSTEHHPGRFFVHDLLRAYAAELTRTEDTDAQRSGALERLLDHYLHTAHAAALRLSPHREPIPLGDLAAGVSAESPADREQALAWLAEERPALVAGVGLAAPHWYRAWALAWTVVEYLDLQGHWPEFVHTQQIALEAAARLEDAAALAYSHRCLGVAYRRLGRDDEALHHLEQALSLSVDDLGRARAHLDLAGAHETQHRYADALRESQRALALFRTVENKAGQARALNAVGWCHTRLGDHEQAVAHCEQALAVTQELGDRHGMGETYDSLGYAHHHLGRHSEAVTCFRTAIGLFGAVGDRYYQANAMTHLGDVLHAAGDQDAARESYAHALAILVDLDHPDAALVRHKLR